MRAYRAAGNSGKAGGWAACEVPPCDAPGPLLALRLGMLVGLGVAAAGFIGLMAKRWVCSATQCNDGRGT